MTAYKKNSSGYLPFIQKNEYEAIYSTIQNRAKLDSSLKVIFGNERIHVNSISPLTKEFGPNGERVFEPNNGDARIRFVGSWSAVFDTNGMYVQCANNGEFVEVTFYGTGLNVLVPIDTSGRNAFPTVDNNSEGADIFLNTSGVLNGRNYKSNQVVPVVSALTLGWHTVKIRNDGASLNLYTGFEILNEASQITIKAGKAHGNGYEYEVANDQLIDYKIGFDNVADVNVGTKGGRVSVYLDPSSGLVKKRLTKTDAATAYLSLADHSNEAPYRKINWREFGRNRADDFSTLSTTASSRVFTLDDGVTTLIGKDVSSGVEDSLRLLSSSAYWVFTFVGTGLDLDTLYDGLLLNSLNFLVDGVSVGVVTSTSKTGRYITKVCSGLPYGTHTVSVSRTGFTEFDMYVNNFIVYQPKKPTLPEGAIELADYNIVSDFVGIVNSGVINNTETSIGVLRKNCAREQVYSGAWSAIFNVADISGITIATSTINNYVDYTFFGTGVELIGRTGAAATSVIISIDGAAYTGAAFAQGSGNTWTSGTSTWVANGGGTFNGRLQISGLPLGKHTVRITKLASDGQSFHLNAVDVITPIHAPHTTLGSLSLRDARNLDSNKDVNKKEEETKLYAICDLINSIAKETKGISQILKTGTGVIQVYFENSFKNRDYTMTGSNVAGQFYGLEAGIFPNMRTVIFANSVGGGVDSLTNCVEFFGKIEELGE